MRLSVLKPYLIVAAALVAATFFNKLTSTEGVIQFLHGGEGGHPAPPAIALVALCFTAVFASSLAKKSGVPVYVLLLLVGVAFAAFMEPFQDVVAQILAALAGLVLAKAGLETDLKDLKATGFQVLSLSVVGLLITAILFSGTLMVLGPWFGTPVSAAAANLTGAAIASTDPAAIVPTLGALTWLSAHAVRMRTIAVSESAGTDVTGALVVSALAASALITTMSGLFSSGYGSLATGESLAFLGTQLFGGVLGGAAGFAVLWLYQKSRDKDDLKAEGDRKDLLIFIGAAFLAFWVAYKLHGNVFLATFLAGLFFNVEEHLKHAHHDYDEKIDEYATPFIFVLGGLLVGVDLLWQYAPLGIASALILIFGIRYIAVFISLLSFLKIKVDGEPMNVWGDIKFLATVRQIGAIGIVLAADIASKNIPDTEAVVPLTVWAAILTLLICTMRVGPAAIKSGLARKT